MKPFPSFLKATIAALILGITMVAVFVWIQTRDPKIGGDFSLVYQDHSFTFSEHPLDLNLLYFGYVKCPDVCPLSLSQAAVAFQGLKEEELKNVRLIFVSVDSEHDTAESVADFAKNFFQNFIGLTGSASQIKTVVDQFRASFVIEKNAKSYLGYSIAHTDRLLFLNEDGILIDSISSPRSADEILTKIRGYL